jgi:tetratricopeptide (TPR) repeat protein
MTTKLREWNFRKNTTRTERESVVLKGTPSTQLEQMMGGRRITSFKVERWQKEMKPSSNQRSRQEVFRNADQPRTTDRGIDAQIEAGSSSASSSSMADPAQIFEVGKSPISSMSNSTVSDPDVALESSNFTNDTWPFASTAVVDVIGSPKLSRLFAALKLECPTDIDPFSLPEPAFPTPPEAIGCLSQSDLMDLHNKKNGDSDSQKGKEVVRYDYYNTRFFFQLPLPGSSPQRAFSRKFPEFDVWFPSGVLMNPSPLNELYVFPSPTPKLVKDTPGLRTQAVNDRFLELELSKKLAKLQPLLHEYDPKILQTMNELAGALLNQGKYLQAEELFRKLAGIFLVTCGPNSEGYLWAQVDLSNTLACLDRDPEADKILRSIERAIALGFKAPDPLVLEFLNTKAWVARGMGDRQGDENCGRELLQITLGSYGLRHPETLHAIRNLASPLKRKGSLQESEQLLRIVVQLSNEVNGVCSETELQAMSILAEILSLNNQYIDSVRLSRLALGRAKVLLGPTHGIAVRCSRQLAISLRGIGYLRESEQALKEIIENQSATLGEKHVETLVSLCFLGSMLYDDGRYAEAIPCFRKALWGDSQSIVAPTKKSQDVCYWLGKCYERLGDNEGARALYFHYIHKIRAAAGEAHPYVIEVREWITELPEPFNAPNQD